MVYCIYDVYCIYYSDETTWLSTYIVVCGVVLVDIEVVVLCLVLSLLSRQLCKVAAHPSPHSTYPTPHTDRDVVNSSHYFPSSFPAV